MKLASWLAQAQVQRVKTKDKKEGLVGNVFFLPLKESLTLLQKIVEEHCLSWQKDNLIKNNKEMIYFVGQQGPVWIIQPHFFSKTDSMYLQGRDLMGQAVGFFRAHQLQKVKIDVANTNEDFLLGAFVGLDLAVYQYKNFENKNPYQDQPELVISSHEKINFKKIMDQAIS
ncbi:MAG: hypothetical protein ACOYOK_16365, partial [Pseudobdellovibrionaceae bacterium]